MKNKPINTGRLFLFCVFQIISTPFYASSLTKIKVDPISICQQQSQIHGQITDSNGMPLAGVSIIVKGTQRGTSSDFNGSYALQINTNDVLVFSFIGFKTQEVPVQGSRELNVIMETDITTLNTVEINAGYYTVKDRERTGSIATIKAKTIEKQPVNNPLAAMQGHLTGVDIRQTTGLPGGGYDIEIRGKNFISGNTNPLFIVDGIPFGSQSIEAGEVSSNINRGNVSPLNSLNSLDIESIEVLKDADATAIYGSRGANGVVLITTKKGKIGKTRFNFNVNNSIGRVTRFRKLMNTKQYLETRREAISNDNFDAYFDNPSFDYIWPDLKKWDQNRYTDWQKELIGGTAYRNNMQISASGGNSQTQFLVSGSYLKETTVFPGNSNYKKTSVHNSLTHNSKDERFKMNLSASYTLETNNLPYSDFTLLANTLEPNAPELYTENGELNWEDGSWNNPLANLQRQYEMKTNTLIGNSVLSYRLLDQLEIKLNLGYNRYEVGSFVTYPSTALNPNLGYGSEYSSTIVNASHRDSWIMEPQLNWKKEWGDFSVSVLLGSTIQKETEKRFVVMGRGYPNNNLILTLSAANNVNILKDQASEYNYMAYFGRFNFNLKSKYILNLTGRRDGSSRFGSNKRFGNFGAIGLAWIFSKENIFNQSSWLSFGKLRGSYGATGSDNIGDYKYLGTYKITGHDYNGISTIEPSGVFNPNFGWEVNKKLELGLELGLFNDRIIINTDIYQNRSSNQLIGIPLAATTGFSSLTGNFNATVENKGYEFELQTINVKTKQFNWSTSFSLTLPKNKLVKFPNLESSVFANKYIIGKSLSIVHLYHALGVDSETGIYQFEDYNEDGEINASEDKKWIEDLAPQFYGGFRNSLSYKNLSLDFFFQFKNQKCYNNLSRTATVGFKRNGPEELVGRWQEPGDTSVIQRATMGAFPGASIAGQNQSHSNKAISNGSFIRLRNISLNYKVPNLNSSDWDLNLYIQGQNLLTLTDYNGADPEQTSYEILPPLKQITVGLQLTF